MSSPYLILRNNETLQPIAETAYSDGKVYDLYNTQISQSINGEYNVTFNILPYLDVWRIGYPNIVELDDDYFQVSRIEKSRSNALDMRVDLEHISYELNQSVLDFEEDENPDLDYSGYPEVILGEMLAGTRFIVDPDLDVYIFMDEVEFTTSQKGVRNRILELAEFCGVEAVFNQFKVNLVTSRGENKGVSLEVGKNIIGMTEITETAINGQLVKSYEVDTIDLNHIVEDGQSLEMHDIKIGDALQVIDDQFGIDYEDRVYSISYDPFKKALPQIVLSNRIPSTANTSNVNTAIVVGGGGVGKGKGLKNVYLEAERDDEYPRMESVFDEEEGYYTDEQVQNGVDGYFNIYIDGSPRGFEVKQGKTYSGFIQVMHYSTPERSMLYEHSTTLRIVRHNPSPEMLSISDHEEYQYSYVLFEDTVTGSNPTSRGGSKSFSIIPFSFYASVSGMVAFEVDYWRGSGDTSINGTEFITGLIQFEDDNAGGGGSGSEVLADFANRYNYDGYDFNYTMDGSVEDNQLFMRVNGGCNYLMPSATYIQAGLSVVLKSDTAMLIECLLYEYGGDDDDIYEVEAYQFKFNVNEGYTTIGIPFALRTYARQNISYALAFNLTTGSIRIEHYDARIYTKGENIELYEILN